MRDNKLILALDRISKFFGGLMAVADVTLNIFPGELVSIIGPNGAGKTTLLNLINGCLQPSAGEIWFKGVKLNKVPTYRISALGIGRTFQDLQIFNNLSVIDNVMIGADGKSQVGLCQVMSGLKRAKKEEKEIFERAMAKLSLVGLEKKARHMPASLTVKERKLLGIARTLATEPELLLLDEPASGLATQEIEEIADFNLRLQEQGMTIIVVEHRMEFVMSISSRVVVLDFGKIIADDVPAKVQQDQRVITAYLGESLM